MDSISGVPNYKKEVEMCESIYPWLNYFLNKTCFNIVVNYRYQLSFFIRTNCKYKLLSLAISILSLVSLQDTQLYSW